MADVTVKILTPATSFDLMTLDELKKMLGMLSSTPTTDDQLNLLIESSSDAISTLCNRVFAFEEVRETWRCLGSRRVYLTHWPVKEADIESVTTNGADRIDYELEEGSGKLSIFTNREEPIVVTYKGGFKLPEEAPPALKQACAMMAAMTKANAAAISLTGVRMIAHKEARVMFHTPTGNVGGSGGASSPFGTNTAIDALLYHYIRPWV